MSYTNRCKSSEIYQASFPNNLKENTKTSYYILYISLLSTTVFTVLLQKISEVKVRYLTTSPLSDNVKMLFPGITLQ